MSADLEARRLVRDLLRSGHSVEEVFDMLVDELLKSGLERCVVVEESRSKITLTFSRAKTPRVEPVAVVPDSEREHVGPVIEVNGEDVEGEDVR